MSWKAYGKLPVAMQNDTIEFYYNKIKKKRVQLIIKRILDILLSAVLIILFLPIMILIAVCIKIDSKGKVIYKQTRIKQYLEPFTIYKFRTMKSEIKGRQLTCENDSRITRMGHLIRAIRLDELPQLFNIIKGDMSFVGARPEIPKFVEKYNSEMLATLLMPVGLTCMASIKFKNEAELLFGENPELVYVNKILPDKMQYNIDYLKNFSCFEDLVIIMKTFMSVFDI